MVKNKEFVSMDDRHPVPAAAAVIIEGGRILLVQRSEQPSKGKWSIPGGKVEWGESLISAVAREVLEETGLEVEVGDVAGVFDLVVMGREGIEFHYVIIDYFARPTGGELHAGSDACDVRWIPLEQLDYYELTEHLRERLKELLHRW